MVYDNSRNLFSGGAHDRNAFQNSKAAGKASPFPPVRSYDRSCKSGGRSRQTLSRDNRRKERGSRRRASPDAARSFPFDGTTGTAAEIGRASCRERGESGVGG